MQCSKENKVIIIDIGANNLNICCCEIKENLDKYSTLRKIEEITIVKKG